MGSIPVSGGNSPETHITWSNGTKRVTSDGGSEVNWYWGGQGKPDGPGHHHLSANFDKNGNLTRSWGRVD